MKFKLKDGRTVAIIPFGPKTTARIPASAFLKFINDLISEDVYLLYDKKFTLAEEKKWKKEHIAKAAKNLFVGFTALSGRRVIATVGAMRDRGKGSDNVCCGIAITKGFRGLGLGEKMLRMLIQEAKKRLKPKNIYLTVIANNRPAISLYKKLGFTKLIGRQPKWSRHKGRYLDVLTLLLR